MSAAGEREDRPRTKVPEHPALATTLAQFEDGMTRVALGIVSNPGVARPAIAANMRRFEQSGVADSSILTDRARAVFERISVVFVQSLGAEPGVMAPMILAAWLTAYALAQEYEACLHCGHWDTEHASWCPQRALDALPPAQP